MIAIREIRGVEPNSVWFRIPDDFLHRRVEIIVLPMDDEPHQSEKSSFELSRFVGLLADFPDIEHEGESEERAQW